MRVRGCCGLGDPRWAPGLGQGQTLSWSGGLACGLRIRPGSPKQIPQTDTEWGSGGLSREPRVGREAWQACSHTFHRFRTSAGPWAPALCPGRLAGRGPCSQGPQERLGCSVCEQAVPATAWAPPATWEGSCLQSSAADPRVAATDAGATRATSQFPLLPTPQNRAKCGAWKPSLVLPQPKRAHCCPPNSLCQKLQQVGGDRGWALAGATVTGPSCPVLAPGTRQSCSPLCVQVCSHRLPPQRWGSPHPHFPPPH